MLPRLYLMNPALWSVPATKVTLLRRTPSICARNSWVSITSSEPVRSRMRSSQRHMRASTEWLWAMGSSGEKPPAKLLRRRDNETSSSADLCP